MCSANVLTAKVIQAVPAQFWGFSWSLDSYGARTAVKVKAGPRLGQASQTSVRREASGDLEGGVHTPPNWVSWQNWRARRQTTSRFRLLHRLVASWQMGYTCVCSRSSMADLLMRTTQEGDDGVQKVEACQPLIGCWPKRSATQVSQQVSVRRQVR